MARILFGSALGLVTLMLLLLSVSSFVCMCSQAGRERLELDGAAIFLLGLFLLFLVLLSAGGAAAVLGW